MRRLMFFALGLLVGAAVGSTLALLLTPDSGDGLRHKAKSHVRNALSEAQIAAETRRREMEAQLAHMTGLPSGKTAHETTPRRR